MLQGTDNGNLFRSTRATIFFGTPHRGLQVDDILAMTEDGSARANLVSSIAVGSTDLEKKLEVFKGCAATLKIISFYETTQTRKLVKVCRERVLDVYYHPLNTMQGPDDSWSRSGELFTSVTDESSLLQLPEAIERCIPIEGDHSNMVKFTHKNNLSYTTLVWHIKDFVLADAGAAHTGENREIWVPIM